MEKSNRMCPYGDCPGLDGGPRSREHDGRLTKSAGTVQGTGQMIKTGVTATDKSATDSNAAKG